MTKCLYHSLFLDLLTRDIPLAAGMVKGHHTDLCVSDSELLIPADSSIVRSIYWSGMVGAT